MRSLLTGETGEAITDLAGWQRRTDDIRGRFLRTLGEPPDSQRLHDFQIETPAPCEGGVRRSLLRIRVDEDDVMEAWLLEPDASAANGRVALAPHPTTD